MGIRSAWDDAVFGSQHRHDFEKVADVGNQKWVEWATKIVAYFMEGQVATYATAEQLRNVHEIT